MGEGTGAVNGRPHCEEQPTQTIELVAGTPVLRNLTGRLTNLFSCDPKSSVTECEHLHRQQSLHNNVQPAYQLQVSRDFDRDQDEQEAIVQTVYCIMNTCQKYIIIISQEQL